MKQSTTWGYYELCPERDGPRIALVAALATGVPDALEAEARRWEGHPGPSSLGELTGPHAHRRPR